MNKIIYLYNKFIGKKKKVILFGGLDAYDNMWWVFINNKEIIGFTSKNDAFKYANDTYPNIPWEI